MKKLMLIPLLALGACDDPIRNVGDRTQDICYQATDGLTDRHELSSSCYDEVMEAEFNARHIVAQKYRDMPRVTEIENAD